MDNGNTERGAGRDQAAGAQGGYQQAQSQQGYYQASNPQGQAAPQGYSGAPNPQGYSGAPNPQGYSSAPNPQRPAYGYPPGYYAQPQLPPEVRRWNWGAFMMNWIWGCSNGAFLTLLCFVPLFNIVWVFVCGARGNRWAWQSGKFKDLETFLAVQRTWNIAGIILFVISIAYIVFFIGMIALAAAPFAGILDNAIDSYTYYGDFGDAARSPV